MYNILLALYFSQLYCFLSWYDYTSRKLLYINHPNIINKLNNIFDNVFIYIPSSICIVLTLYPMKVFMYNIFTELWHFFIHISTYDIWFYTFNNLFHNRLFDIFKNEGMALGIFALYAHPIDALITRIGSICVLHYMLNLSFCQILVIITYRLVNTILPKNN